MAQHTVILFSQSIAIPKDYFANENIENVFYNLKSWPALKAMIEQVKPHVVVVFIKSTDHKALTPLLHYKKQLPFGLIVISDQYSLSIEKASFHAGADHFLLLQTSKNSILQRLTNLCIRMDQLKRSQNTTYLPSPSWVRGEFNQGPFTIESKTGFIYYHRERLLLTPTQNKLLSCFLHQPDILLTREDLRRLVWKNSKISDRTIDAHIAKLKKSVPALDEILKGVYGRGYIYQLNQLSVA